ncbi:MAG: hypothetical protein JSR92_19820 [Proteobacteria bacterium]|jgi:hypothetical protein|nr:hypothetical protein [Pseudomonadota bacterium]
MQGQVVEEFQRVLDRLSQKSSSAQPEPSSPTGEHAAPKFNYWGPADVDSLHSRIKGAQNFNTMNEVSQFASVLMDVIKKQQHQLDYQNSAIRNLCQGCNDLLLVVTALVDERVGE